ncbi:MAG: hypothetical protein AB7V46_00260 [Thermomicrobiales bacterium]
MSSISTRLESSNRRDLVKAGSGVFAALAGVSLVSRGRAQDASPEAATGRDLNGYYGVTRTYVVVENADLEALVAVVEGYAALISQSPGFAAYSILYNDETRVWTAFALFDTAENAQASTDSAASFVQENDLGSSFEDPTPVVVEGRVIVNAGF